MEYAVEIKGVTKKYKNFTLDVSAVIPKGFSVALIGANGAGKTTLIDILCGITSKNGGEAVYFGDMTDTDDDVLRNRIGYCSAANYFPLDWKLKTIAECMPLGYDSFDRARFTELCESWKLGSPDDKKQSNMMKMSDGNRMRAALAAVLARDTDLLVLDEPASSLDPLARDMLCIISRIWSRRPTTRYSCRQVTSSNRVSSRISRISIYSYTATLKTETRRSR